MAISSAKPPADESIMDVPGLARFFRVSERTIASKLNEIPHFRVGKQIRFHRDTIVDWIGQQHVANTTVQETE